MILFLLVVALPGCSWFGQSATEGYRVLCEAPQRCPECMAAPADQQGVRLHAWIDQHVTHPEVRAQFASLDQPTGRAADVIDAARQHGVTPCPLLDAEVVAPSLEIELPRNER